MSKTIPTWQDRTEEKLKELGAAFLGKQTEIVMDALRAENAELRAALQAQQGDALDAARWRFMMRAGDDENGAEAKALEASKLGDEAMETDRPASVQLAEIVDAAMLAARREG